MSRRDAREPGAMIYGGVPRAHLMPPEVAQNRKEAGRRRQLISAVLAVVILVVGGVGASFWASSQAQARLADERLLTEQLLAEQLTYSEVLEVRGQLADINEQRLSVVEREILWLDVSSPYLDIVSIDGIVESAILSSAALGDPPLLRTGALRTQPTATLILTVVTQTSPLPANWLRQFESVDTYGDASIDAITLEATGYFTSITVNLNMAALSERLVVAEEESD